MTGALLGGADVAQAARLQMVIMFLICGSSVLAAVACTIACLSIVIDTQARVRLDRVDSRPHVVWRARRWVVARVVDGLAGARDAVTALMKRGAAGDVEEEESGPLLG